MIAEGRASSLSFSFLSTELLRLINLGGGLITSSSSYLFELRLTVSEGSVSPTEALPPTCRLVVDASFFFRIGGFIFLEDIKGVSS